MSAPSLPPVGPDMRQWGQNITGYLRRTMDRIRYYSQDDIPAQNGTLLWDEENGYPIVAKDGEFRQLVIANGYAQFSQDADITAASANTAYSITYDAPSFSIGVSRDAVNPERIVFEEGGVYLLAFTAQISSTSASTVTFRFWPAINGIVSAGTAMVANLHESDASTVVSRSALFQVSAGDYLEARWAVSSTNGSLRAHTSTAYAPSSPSTTLTVARIRA